jgi:hypothetical protein
VENPVVACVITTSHEKTLQFDGYIQMTDGLKANDARQKMLKAQPDFADFFND